VRPALSAERAGIEGGAAYLHGLDPELEELLANGERERRGVLHAAVDHVHRHALQRHRQLRADARELGDQVQQGALPRRHRRRSASQSCTID
jgi:hypothetical protein